MTPCSRCGKLLAGAELARIPLPLAWAAALALAMAHGGMWTRAELAKPFCARCRRRVAGFVLLAALVMAAIAAAGIRLWLTMPKMPK